MQNISIFRGRRTSLLPTVSLRYFIPCIKRAIKELEWNVRRFGWSFDIVHRQEIAMFSYLTGSLDYAFSNHIFILGCIMRFVAEYIMQSGVHRPLVKDLSFVDVFSSFCFFPFFFVLSLQNSTVAIGNRVRWERCVRLAIPWRTLGQDRKAARVLE